MYREYKPRQPAGRVENYTTAFLWMFGLILFMGFVAIWGFFGYLISLATAYGIRAGIDRLPRQQ